MSEPLNAGKSMDFDESKGEIRGMEWLERRFGLVDVVGLCHHLDMLLGEKVAEFVVASYGRQSGKEDLARLRENTPNITLKELIAAFTMSDIFGGYGVTNVTIREDQDAPVEFEMRSPIVQSSTGTAVKFILSYWIGAINDVLGKTLDIARATYDPNENVLRCQLAIRNSARV